MTFHVLDCSKEVDKGRELKGELMKQEAALSMLSAGLPNAKLPTSQLLFADFPSFTAQCKHLHWAV